jgi:hypothetical protein
MNSSKPLVDRWGRPLSKFEIKMMELEEKDRPLKEAWEALAREDWKSAGEEETRRGIHAWMKSRERADSPAVEALARRALDFGWRLIDLGRAQDLAREGLAEPLLAAHFLKALEHPRATLALLASHPNYQWGDTIASLMARSSPDWNAPGLPEDEMERSMALMGGSSSAGPDGCGLRVAPVYSAPFFAHRPHLRQRALRALEQGVLALGGRIGPREPRAQERLENVLQVGRAIEQGPADPSVERALLDLEKACAKVGAAALTWSAKIKRDALMIQAWDQALYAAWEIDEPEIALALAPGLLAHPLGGGRLAARALKAGAVRCAVEILASGLDAGQLLASDVASAVETGAFLSKARPKEPWGQALRMSSRECLRQAGGRAPEVAQEIEALATRAVDQLSGKDPKIFAWGQKALLDLVQELALALAGPPMSSDNGSKSTSAVPRL